MIKYEKLSKIEFDAVVTGELTHMALHLEHTIGDMIISFFQVCRGTEFRRLILDRDGLTFQHKIEIVRCCLPLMEELAAKHDLKKLLNRVEEFKAWRNALAHGHDDGSTKKPLRLVVSMVNRGGRDKVVEITKESHEKMLDEMGAVLDKLIAAEKAVQEFGDSVPSP
jgi:hypothetical protein